jgi:hypothetical protein
VPLTYMSIESWINELVDVRRELHPIQPGFDSDPVARTMLVSPEVWRLIEGPWPDAACERRCSALRADLENFVVGQEITVSVTPFAAGAADLGLLHPPAAGVWDFRSRHPKPGLRILGQFAAKDTFVALIPATRSVAHPFFSRGPLGVGSSREWRDAIESCKALFRNLFTAFPAIGGDNIHDLLSDESKYSQV